MVYICFVKKTLIIFLIFPFFLALHKLIFQIKIHLTLLLEMQSVSKQGIVTVDSVKEIIEVIDAEIIAFQEINSVSEFNNLISKLDSYNGFSTNNSNLNLAYVYKKNLNIDSIYTILNSENYVFVGRLPLVLEMNYQGEDYVIINNHF